MIEKRTLKLPKVNEEAREKISLILLKTHELVKSLNNITQEGNSNLDIGLNNLIEYSKEAYLSVSEKTIHAYAMKQSYNENKRKSIN